MNWKKFFKPTILKIVVFIVLFLIFVPFIYYDTGVRCFTTPCPAGKLGSVMSYLMFSPNHFIYDDGIRSLNIIIGIILSYLASCMVYYLFQKIIHH